MLSLSIYFTFSFYLFCVSFNNNCFCWELRNFLSMCMRMYLHYFCIFLFSNLCIFLYLFVSYAFFLSFFLSFFLISLLHFCIKICLIFANWVRTKAISIPLMQTNFFNLFVTGLSKVLPHILGRFKFFASKTSVIIPSNFMIPKA